MRESHLARRDAILDTATRRFARSGYHGTSMQALSRALGMTKGNLYNYFRDKEAILFACHERALDALDTLSARVLAEGAASTRLELLVAGLLEVATGDFGEAALALDLDALAEAHAAEVRSRRDAFEQVVRRVVAEGVAKGELRGLDPRLASFALLGAVNWTARYFDPAGGSSPRDFARTFSDLFLDGLRRRKGIAVEATT